MRMSDVRRAVDWSMAECEANLDGGVGLAFGLALALLPELSVGSMHSPPVPLGDDLDGAVDHFDGGLIVNRVRRD